MGEHWYVKSGGQEQGPLAAGALVKLLRTGKIEMTSQVREGEYGPWSPLAEVIDDIEDDAAEESSESSGAEASGPDEGKSEARRPRLLDEADLTADMSYRAAKGESGKQEPGAVKKIIVVGGVCIVLMFVLYLMVSSMVVSGPTGVNSDEDSPDRNRLRVPPPGGWAFDVQLITDEGKALPGRSTLYLVSIAERRQIRSDIRAFQKGMIEAEEQAAQIRAQHEELASRIATAQRSLQEARSTLIRARQQAIVAPTEAERQNWADRRDQAEIAIAAEESLLEQLEAERAQLPAISDPGQIRSRLAREMVELLRQYAISTKPLTGTEAMVSFDGMDIAQVMVVIMPDDGQWVLARPVNVAAFDSLIFTEEHLQWSRRDE